jgi:hypothetical protein
MFKVAAGIDLIDNSGLFSESDPQTRTHAVQCLFQSHGNKTLVMPNFRERKEWLRKHGAEQDIGKSSWGSARPWLARGAMSQGGRGAAATRLRQGSKNGDGPRFQIAIAGNIGHYDD